MNGIIYNAHWPHTENVNKVEEVKTGLKEIEKWLQHNFSCHCTQIYFIFYFKIIISVCKILINIF